MEILVCVKRVPTVGGVLTLTADKRAIDTKTSGFTISPHEECAVEEAVRLVERFGGSVTVASLGPVAAEEQLRACLALGASAAVLLETADGVETGPITTAAALHAVAAAGAFDLVLLGNEASDTGDYQVGVRVAHALGLPCVTGIKGVAIEDRKLTARREAGGGWEIFELPLPAVVTVKEGINLPRYASLPGRLRAKTIPIARIEPQPRASALETIRLVVPREQETHVEIIDGGAEAAPRVVEVLRELGLVTP